MPAGPDAARPRQDTDEGRTLHDVRAGVEGTLSPAVRAFGLRRACYRGLPKTLVQHAGAAAARSPVDAAPTRRMD